MDHFDWGLTSMLAILFPTIQAPFYGHRLFDFKTKLSASLRLQQARMELLFSFSSHSLCASVV
jgi:hypothetical protein